jgi:hypothetical protein
MTTRSGKLFESRVDRNPLTINLQMMVTTPRNLNMDQLQYHLTLQPQVAQETDVHRILSHSTGWATKK